MEIYPTATHLVLLLLSLLMTCITGRVLRCFDDADCVPNDVCINKACYEIKTFEERCTFDQECSHLNRKLVCHNGQCDCQSNLIWIWSISKCRQPGYCQIDQDCPGTDFKCNYTSSRCSKINPVKIRAKKLARTASASTFTARPSILMQVMVASVILLYTCVFQQFR